MGTETGIAWTKHTFSPWWGCTKVHAGCTSCYAESWDKRYGPSHWGNNPRRMIIGEWGKPEKWDREAKQADRVDPVFCASMCDLFEDYDGPVVDQRGNPVPMRDQAKNWTIPLLRARVFEIIEKTRNLLWQLLTKRPENINHMVPASWHKEWPANVITGTSPCNQETADASIPHLLKVPGRHFLSCEPLLGDIRFATVPGFNRINLNLRDWWVIVGVESKGKLAGRNAEHYHEHARSIIDQCSAAGVPVFHKQMPINGRVSHDPAEWPEWARVQEMPRC